MGTADNLVLAEDRSTGGRQRRGPVRVHAASVFIGDWHVVTGLPYAIRPKLELGQPKARVRGQEMAGRVADRHRHRVGDRVGEFLGPNEEHGRSLAGTAIPVLYIAWSVWLLAMVSH